MKDYMKVTEVADRFNLGPDAIRVWLRQGLIQGIKIHSRLWLVDRASVEEAADADRIPPKPGRPRKGAK